MTPGTPGLQDPTEPWKHPGDLQTPPEAQAAPGTFCIWPERLSSGGCRTLTQLVLTSCGWKKNHRFLQAALVLWEQTPQTVPHPSQEHSLCGPRPKLDQNGPPGRPGTKAPPRSCLELSEVPRFPPSLFLAPSSQATELPSPSHSLLLCSDCPFAQRP